jgi:hypothetical protein
MQVSQRPPMLIKPISIAHRAVTRREGWGPHLPAMAAAGELGVELTARSQRTSLGRCTSSDSRASASPIAPCGVTGAEAARGCGERDAA